MRNEHIIALLDSNRFGNLSGSDSARVEAHLIHCEGCRQAYAAAKVTAALLQARSAEAIEPPPFFSTRVMALIREQKNETSLFDLVNLWKTARSSVLSAISVVVLLGGITFLVPGPPANEQARALGQPFYSTEVVVFGDEAAHLDDSPDDEQVMDEVLSPEETDAGSQ